MISADPLQPPSVDEEVGWIKTDSFSQHCESVELYFFNDLSAGSCINDTLVKKNYNFKLVTDNLSIRNSGAFTNGIMHV